MLSEDQKKLWHRINNFTIDDPLASIKYSDKLSFHNGWTADYTKRVIEEYKKFIFLCCVLPGGASPSKPIDEAWHLHLTYTHNYWKRFCFEILEKEVHHYPSRGGPEEKEKHIVWYENTLRAYQVYFQSEPPADIWLRPTVTPQPLHLEDNNKLKEYKVYYKKYFYLLLAPFLVPVFFGKLSPFQITGPQFLIFYFLLISGFIILLVLAGKQKTKEVKDLIAKKYRTDADIYQLARFVYGREKSLRAAVVDLVEKDILEAIRKNNFIYHSDKHRYSTTENNPLAIGLLKNCKDGHVINFTSLSAYYDDEQTYHASLSSLYKSICEKDYLPVIVATIICLIGFVRILQGAFNDKPVDFLTIMCILFVVVSIKVIKHFTGTRVLQNEFSTRYQNSELPEFTSSGLASSFVFLGFAHLALLDKYSYMRNTFSNFNETHESSSGWTSGCGSDGSGSDGGGGCSGCGGCGGGD